MNNLVKTCVIGHPVAHSKSPLIHNYWIRKYNLAGEYGAVDIEAASLRDRVRDLVRAGYAGFNVTMPHKEEIMALCHYLDDAAKQAGAVNTVIVREGKLQGTNTDVFGLIENIRSQIKDFDFAAGPAAVLGAGGAARAAVCGLLQQGAPEIRLCSRTKEKAERLRDLSLDPARIKICSWGARHGMLGGINLLINTTPLGMAGQQSLEIDLASLDEGAVVNDIVYKPARTNFLKAAQQRGNRTVDGIGMLLHQARPAFAAWYGVMPEIDDALLNLVNA